MLRKHGCHSLENWYSRIRLTVTWNCRIRRNERDFLRLPSCFTTYVLNPYIPVLAEQKALLPSIGLIRKKSRAIYHLRASLGQKRRVNDESTGGVGKKSKR